MTFDIDSLVGKVRTAIDDIKKFDSDEFYADADSEIKQALFLAAMQIVAEADPEMLEPTKIKGNLLIPATIGNSDGTGHIVVPDDYMRFVEMKMHTWALGCRALTPLDSPEGQQQASVWGRGSCHKPVVMEAWDSEGNKILRYFSVGTYAINNTEEPIDVYDHRCDYLYYIPMPKVGNDEKLYVGLKAEAEGNIIFRAAGIFLEGKKEGELADRMYKLSGMSYGE